MSTEINNSTIQYLSPNSFQFSLIKLPEVTYQWNTVQIPAITFGNATQNTPMLDLPIIGEKLLFEPLEVTFIVDQQMKNYLAIDRWMRSEGPPDDDANFGSDSTGSIPQKNTAETNYQNNYSDATLVILDSQNTPIVRVFFQDCFPVELSGWKEISDANGVNYVVATAIFKYSMYKFL